VNRKHLILGISIGILLLMISGVALWRDRQNKQAQVDERNPLQRLAYCSSDQVTPCIVSFSLDADGAMLVSFLTSGAFYPDFYLKIQRGEDQHIYNCQKINKFATSVYCTGAAMPPGEILQFSIFSLREDVLLAEGKFPIIGLALGTPVVLPTPTLGTPSTPSPTEEFPLETITPVQGIPTLTPTPPTSYPNYP
jgi:hypothetical protein